MVNEGEFRNRHFETRGILEFLTRVAAGYKWQQDRRELVHSMSRMLEVVLQARRERGEKSPSIERTVADQCDIPYNTYKKYMGLKRPVTRVAIAKFAVGLHLSLDDANRLFRLQGGELNETNDFDYITLHALRDKDNVQDFLEEVEKYTAVNTHRAL
ncbi:MAG: hypothetical protein LBP21_08340 [Synergistaceae bacterium]|jgi:hypothetical protein|nr:hypothetical protein [Synergistaceae bacterium]